MDLSALIFVALAVAWAAYLIPKALKHQDAATRSRSIEVFSDRLRVLARRDAVSRRNAELLVDPDRPRPAAHVGPQTLGELRQQAANRAARRRRNVLTGLVLLLALVIAMGADGAISWWWTTAPTALLAAWLVACRLMVKRERSVRVPSARPSVDSTTIPVTPVASEDAPELEETGAMSPVTAEVLEIEGASWSPVAASGAAEIVVGDDGDPSRWDMIPVTLPTYVSKPVATRRTVQTIDLDSTGVWSSGRSEIDSALAREAEVSAREARDAAAADAEKRASGS